MVRLGIVGLGKMGISHLAIAKAHPDIDLVAICDTMRYVLDILEKYTGVRTYTDYERMLADSALDALIIATPTRLHMPMLHAALERKLHVFCEKPLCLDAQDGAAIVALAQRQGVANQVGYHCRFVATFQEARTLLSTGVLGRVHHARVEVYGPVVVRSKTATWRSRHTEGGGCLADYACHGVDLINYLLGCPERVGGTVLGRIFSEEVEDEVYSTLLFPNGATAQVACNWSDSSCRKMESRVQVWGSNGSLAVDRQEIKIYLRESPGAGRWHAGWNSASIPDLVGSPDFYLRGEEYSAQLAHFVEAIQAGRPETLASFASAAETDKVIALMRQNADPASSRHELPSRPAAPVRQRRFAWARLAQV